MKGIDLNRTWRNKFR